MTIMNTELYEALIAAGAPDDKAKAASHVTEEQRKRFDSLDSHSLIMQKEIDHRFDKVDHHFELMNKQFELLDNKIENVEKRVVTELNMLKWIGGIIVAGLVAVLARLVFFSG